MTDEVHLEAIQQEVLFYLKQMKAPPTTKNVIHAMFDMHYADWLCGESNKINCPMDRCQRVMKGFDD